MLLRLRRHIAQLYRPLGCPRLSSNQQCNVSNEQHAGEAGQYQSHSRLRDDPDEPGADEDRDEDEQDVTPSLSGFPAEEGVLRSTRR